MFKRKMRGDSRGLTLIELVCAVAILAIISATVGGAMVVATNSYKSGTVETAMQQEAQFTANAIEALIIDATDTVEFSGNVLKIANVDYTYEITYDPSAQTLRYTQYETNNPSNVVAANELIAEHMASFDVDASAFPTARTVQLAFTMENQGRRFSTAYNITSRNNPDAGTPLELTALILVMDKVTLEPNQTYPLEVSVAGSANKNWHCYFDTTHDPSPDASFSVTPTTITLQIGPTETGGSDGVLPLIVETDATGASGAPLDRKRVDINIRRVLGFDWTSFVLREGSALAQDAVYSISATPNGTNLAKVPGALYDTDYVDPNTLKWTFNIVGGSGSGSDYVQIIDPPGDSSNEVWFKLKQNISNGMTLEVVATAQHPNGINKTSSVYGSVVDHRDLVASGEGLSVSGQLRRGTEGYVDVNLNHSKLVEEEWKRNHPGETPSGDDAYNGGFQGNIYFRYKSTDADPADVHTSPNYPQWIRMTDQGNDPQHFKFNANDFQNMKFMKDYTIEILYSFKYNKGNNQQAYYPESAYPGGTSTPIPDVDPQYIYSVQLYAFSLKFESYEDATGGHSASPYAKEGSTGLGTFNNPVELSYTDAHQWIKFRCVNVTGSTAARDAVDDLINNTRCYKWDSSNSQWQQVGRQFQLQDKSGDDNFSFYFECKNGGEMQKNVVYKIVMEKVKNETYAREITPNMGGRGVFYIRLH